MNLPNKLTLIRLALVPVFLVFTISDTVWTRIFGLIIFIAASLTDLYDGYFARKYGEVTDFGKFLDPLADKFLISAALIAFVSMRELNVPAWMVILIIGREFLITGLRLLAASKGVVLAADHSGKFKTTSQLTAIITILVILCVNSGLERYYGLSPAQLVQREDWRHTAGYLLLWAPYWLVFAATILTLVSGISYLYKNRQIFAKEVGIQV